MLSDYIISTDRPSGKDEFLRHLERESDARYYAGVAYRQCMDIVHDSATYAEARELIGGLLRSSIKVIDANGPRSHETADFYMRHVYESVMRSLSAAIVREGGTLS